MLADRRGLARARRGAALVVGVERSRRRARAAGHRRRPSPRVRSAAFHSGVFRSRRIPFAAQTSHGSAPRGTAAGSARRDRVPRRLPSRRVGGAASSDAGPSGDVDACAMWTHPDDRRPGVRPGAPAAPQVSLKRSTARPAVRRRDRDGDHGRQATASAGRAVLSGRRPLVGSRAMTGRRADDPRGAERRPARGRDGRARARSPSSRAPGPARPPPSPGASPIRWRPARSRPSRSSR